MQNEDNKCFLWCVLRALNLRKKHDERIDKELKLKENTLDMDGIEYPISLKDINKFEKQNLTISITVLGYDEKGVYPLRNSDNTDREHNITLMLKEQDEVKHYCLVKDPFNNQEAFDKHKEYCDEYETVKTELPKKGTMLKFKNYYRSEKVPYVVYADFESCLEPIHTCDLNPESSYTKQYQKHKPVCFCYYICFNHKVFAPLKREYIGKNVGEDVGEVFVKLIEEDIKMIANIPPKKMIITDKEREQYENETRCWTCKGEFDDDEKVKDHCHFTGRYRGAAHNLCNLKYRKPNFTPVIFHNLSGYDSHLFIKNLGFSEGNIDCIPNNEEKYISFSKSIQVGSYMKKVKNEKGEHAEKEIKLTHTIRFIDSFKFMAASLDSLVNNLPKDDFINLGLHYSGDKFNLLTKKGVYPYEYMDSLES